MGYRHPSRLAGIVTLLLAAIQPSRAELQACLSALTRLTAAPHNASLPFLNGVSGHINVGYLYQKPMFAVMPNEAMGNFDLCRHSGLYTSGLVDTHYCTLSHDKAGICVPSQCSAEDLHNKALLKPLINLGAQAASAVPTNCVMDPYLTQECAYVRQAWEYYQGLYNALVLLGNDTPYSKGSVTCALHAQRANSAAYTMIAFTILFGLLAMLGAGWQYMCATNKQQQPNKKNAAAVAAVAAAAALSSSSPSSKKAEAASAPSALSPSGAGAKNVALTVQKSPGGASDSSDLVEIHLEESTPRSRKNQKNKNENAVTRSTSNGNNTTTTTTTGAQPGVVEMVAGVMSVPLCPKAVAAFSFVDNWNEVFTLKTRGGEFAVFDGMKAISACWVVFYHALLWQIYFVQNPEYIIPPKGLLSKWWAAPFFNYSGTLSVDTFFFISGFLASYCMLVKLDKESARGEAKQSAWKWVPTMYFHRWLRITPAYFFAFFLHWKVAPLLAYGPLAATVWENNTRPCRGIWWSHFLYLNDIYPWWNQRLGDVCYGHSWYLANDMQYFLLVPLLCLLYRSQKVNGKKWAGYVVWACLLSCVITTYALAIKGNWSPNSWDGVEGDHYREEGFSRPWTRCSSYMIGVLFSYYWYEKKQTNPDGKLLSIQANLLWVSGLFLLAIAMYGPHTGSVNVIPCTLAAPGTKCGSGWSASTKAAILAFLRPTWTLGLGLLSVLCWHNQGGYIQKFLAAPAWAPLSALSFCIYLVHYTVLTFYISQRTLRIRFELFGFLNSFFGLMAISCGVALLVVLLVEKPFMKLQKLYFEPTMPAKKTVTGKAAGAENEGKTLVPAQMPKLLQPPKKPVKAAEVTKNDGGAVVAKI